MVSLDFKVRRGRSGGMETISFGVEVGRVSSCPELDICSYANKGERLLDKEKSEQCEFCYWNYENCHYYEQTKK